MPLILFTLIEWSFGWWSVRELWTSHASLRACGAQLGGKATSASIGEKVTFLSQTDRIHSVIKNILLVHILHSLLKTCASLNCDQALEVQWITIDSFHRYILQSQLHSQKYHNNPHIFSSFKPRQPWRPRSSSSLVFFYNYNKSSLLALLSGREVAH